MSSARNVAVYPRLNPVLQDRACGATSGSIEGAGLAFQATTDRVVERGAAGSPSHDGERHCSPGYVDRPAIWHGQFDDDRHEEQSQCCEASRQAKYKQDRKQDLARSRQERKNGRRRKRIRATGQMDHELVGEQRNGSVAELEKAAPLQDTRFPEGDGESEAQDKLDEIRMRDESDNPVRQPRQRDNISTKASVANLSLSIIIADLHL